MPITGSRLIIAAGFILICLFSGQQPTPAKAAPFAPNRIIETVHPASSAVLITSSDAVVHVHLGEQIRKWPTGQRLPNGRLFVNAAQRLYVHDVLKGSSPSSAWLLTTGISPLPEPHDPLNRLYTGPLADGEYILFLKLFSREHNFYTLNGGFGAVYPVYSGKTVALDEGGFPELGGKTIEQVRLLIRSRPPAR